MTPLHSVLPHTSTRTEQFFSWIPLRARHLLFLPHVLCTKGSTCMNTNRLNTHTHTHTHSHINTRGGWGFVLSLGGHTMTPALLWGFFFLSDESIMRPVAVNWGHLASYYKSRTLCRSLFLSVNPWTFDLVVVMLWPRGSAVLTQHSNSF